MKNFLIAVIAALFLVSFTNPKSEVISESISNSTYEPSGFQKQLNKKVWPYYWYTYIGEPNDYFHQFDESYYVLDEDQWPNCTIPLGYIRCEVKCMGDAWIEGRPDFSTIQAIRYRP